MREVLSVSVDKKFKKRIESASKLYRVSKSEIVKQAVERYLIREEFYELRKKLVPYAEKAGFYSDEDIFKEIS